MDVSETLPPVVLRTDLLKRGDVLLTFGGEKESELITKLSDGPFSHAALVLNQFMTFESGGGLIGHRLIRPIGSAIVAGEFRILAKIPGKATEGAVYRHPMMEKVSEDQFAKTLSVEMQESYGRNYSALYRLVEISNLSPRAQRLLISLFRRFENQEPVRGPFCSELVARFFAKLGLPLFDTDLAPEKVTPNALPEPKSKLVLVENAVLSSKGIQLREARKEVKEMIDKMLPLPPTAGTTGLVQDGVDVLAAKRQSQLRIARALQQLDQQVDKIAQQSIASLEQQFDQDIQLLASLVSATDAADRPEETRRVERVSNLCAELLSEFAGLKDPDSWGDGKFQLAIDRWQVFRVRLLRCTTLCASERIKNKLKNAAAGKLSALERWKISRKRKRLVASTRRAEKQGIELSSALSAAQKT
ncbi:MAG: hypothetical protein WB764_04405, partial [Xanthobacteraceae bacterium]